MQMNIRAMLLAKRRLFIFTYIPRGDFSKMASNQALPGPSTSGFSNPSESPWEVQQIL